MTTQFANAQYQEIIDLHTESDRVSVVGIHTPCSDTPYHMLKGFWEQFKKFKYNGCSMSLVPAATLPVDPLQVSYDASEPSIDPRDMLNPIMFHGCHGDDMGAILNSLYSEPVAQNNFQLIETLMSDSADVNEIRTGTTYADYSEVFEALYYKALTDNTWLKAHPQRGFRKGGLHPMVYQLASTVQFGNIPMNTTILSKGNVHDDDTGDVSDITSGTLGTGVNTATVYALRGYGRPTQSVESNVGHMRMPVAQVAGFLTPRLQRLGWMDTRSIVGLGPNDGIDESVGAGEQYPNKDFNQAATNMYLKTAAPFNPVLTPKIFMGMLMLPPAYKQTQHFRLILNHSFSFAKFRGASMQYDNYGMVNKAYSYFNFEDTEDSKHKPQPDVEPKGDDDDGSIDKQ